MYSPKDIRTWDQINGINMVKILYVAYPEHINCTNILNFDQKNCKHLFLYYFWTLKKNIWSITSSANEEWECPTQIEYCL